VQGLYRYYRGFPDLPACAYYYALGIVAQNVDLVVEWFEAQ